jgi:hypothetical protein
VPLKSSTYASASLLLLSIPSYTSLFGVTTNTRLAALAAFDAAILFGEITTSAGLYNSASSGTCTITDMLFAIPAIRKMLAWVAGEKPLCHLLVPGVLIGFSLGIIPANLQVHAQ